VYADTGSHYSEHKLASLYYFLDKEYVAGFVELQ